MGLGRAVVAGPEPDVEGNVQPTVVAFEIAVVQLVEIGCSPQFGLAVDDDRLEAGVRLRRRERGELPVHDSVDRVRGYDPMDQHAAEEDDVLERVHRQAGPGTGVDVAVVQEVRHPVEGRPVQEAVGPIEVELAPKLDRAEQEDEVDRMLPRIQVRDVLVGEGPERYDLVGGPDGAAADTTPEDVVEQLTLPKEILLALRHPLGRILELEALGLAPPQPQVPGADNGDQHDLVAREEVEDPVGAEARHARHLRLQEGDGQHGDEHVDEIPGKEVVEEILGQLPRIGRPIEDRAGQFFAFRLPVPAFVARHPVDQTVSFSADVCHDHSPGETVVGPTDRWTLPARPVIVLLSPVFAAIVQKRGAVTQQCTIYP